MTADIIGLDLSLISTGIATPEGENTIKIKGTGMHRLAEIRKTVLCQIEYFDNPIVYIEGYSFASGNRAAHMGELGGIIRLELHDSGIPYVDVAPGTLKKFATGKGNAGKDLVVSAVTHRAGRVFDSNDVVDAYVLRAIGCVLHDQECPMGPMPKLNVAALDKLRAATGETP